MAVLRVSVSVIRASFWRIGSSPHSTSPSWLTHHEREPLQVGETTFHFVDGTPEKALAFAKEAAGGLDVRIGGGVSTVRQFLDADLIDDMHVAIAPLEYGEGLKLWDSPEDLAGRFTIEKVTAPSGVEHCFL